MKKSILIFIIMLLLYCTPVLAADYIVTVNEGADITGYDLEPVFEEIGLYLTDEATAEQLYERGIAKAITEDKPLVLPDTDDLLQVEDTGGSLAAMSADYNDTYYSEEIYFEQMGIKNYIDTYNPSGQVRIAVIDTGVNREHQDFANANIETGYNFVTNSTDTEDLYRHGTMVTSLIAAGANDGVGVAGIAPNATIVPLVAMTKVNGEAAGTAAHLLLAIRAAVDTYDCKIITTSLGVTAGYSEINMAVRYATGKGVIVISAAGNSGADSDSTVASELSYPASSPGAISVGATDKYYNRASYSQKNERVDVVAFGGTLTMPSNSGTAVYAKANGTSFSAPVVAGMTALFVSNHPDITPKEYRAVLRGAAMDIGDLGSGDFMGCGMPDCMAMERLYNDSNHIFIAPIYGDTDKNIKLMSDGTVNEAVLVSVYMKNGIVIKHRFDELIFDTDNLAYVSGEALDYNVRYFVIDSLDNMQSLSLVSE